MLDTNLAGPWTSEMYAEHLPEQIAFDEGLIRSIIDFYKPHKCLDLGCGLGYFVSYLRDQGVDAWGVEAEDLGERFRSPGHQIQRDLSQVFDLGEKYDLVICLEVVEHIPRDFEDVVFDNIVRHMNKYLLFSGATVRQQGTGHINERLESHWFSHLARRGLVLRHQESIKARLMSNLSWYAKNVSLWELVHPGLHHGPSITAERDSYIMSCESQLNHTQRQVEALQVRLEQAEVGIEQSQSQLQQAQIELKQSQSQLQQTQAKLSHCQATISAMQKSKFWKLREIVLRAKKQTGFGRH